MSSKIRLSSFLGRVPLGLGLGVAVLGITMGSVETSRGAPWSPPVAKALSQLGVRTHTVISVCSLIGFIALAAYCLGEAPSSTGGAGKRRRSVIKMVILLLTSLAAAILLWTMAFSLTHRRIRGIGGHPLGEAPPPPWTYTVLIHNKTNETVTRPRILGCDQDIDLGTLDPGEWEVRSFPLDQGGTLEFSGESAGASYSVAFDEVEPGSQEDRVTVTLHPEGKVTLQHYEIW